METSIELEIVAVISHKAAGMRDLQLALMENGVETLTTGEQAYSELVCYMRGYILGRYPDREHDMRLDNYVCALARTLATDERIYPHWD